MIEAQEKCVALLKKASTRARVLLIVVKALISGNSYDESKGPSKLSMFFIGPNS